jgi:hypothetical protein
VLEDRFGLCQLFHDGLEARLLLLGQVHAGQREIADREFEQARTTFAYAIPVRGAVCAEALIKLVEPLVVAHLGGMA